MSTKRNIAAALAILSILIPVTFLRILIFGIAIIVFFFKEPKKTNYLHNKQNKLSPGIKLEMLPSRKKQGKELLRRSTELSSTHNQDEVAALCGYYIKVNEFAGTNSFRVDTSTYLRAIEAALNINKKAQSLDNQPGEESLDSISNTSMDSRLAGLDLSAMWDFFETHIDCYQHWPLEKLFEGQSVKIQATDCDIDNFDAEGNYLEPDPDSWMFDKDETVVRTVLLVRGIEPEVTPEVEELENLTNGFYYGCHGNIRHCIESDDLARFLTEFLDASGSREILQKISEYSRYSLEELALELNGTLKQNEKQKQTEGHRKLRLTIIETGGHYTIGAVSELNHSHQIISKIMESQMSSYFDFDDGSHFDISECNELLDIYGPHVPGSQLIVEDENSNEIYRGSINESALNIFQSSNPKTWRHSQNENELIIWNKKIEKRIHYSSEIEAKSNKPIRLNEVYVGYCCMEESFNTDDEILQYVLYIPDEKAIEYFREWCRLEGDEAHQIIYSGRLDSSESADDFRDIIYDIFYDNHDDDFCKDFCKKIVNKHFISAEEIEGKGEWECDYVKVAKATYKDHSDFLYEDEGY